jgi:hypothetical protein
MLPTQLDPPAASLVSATAFASPPLAFIMLGSRCGGATVGAPLFQPVTRFVRLLAGQLRAFQSDNLNFHLTANLVGTARCIRL